MNRFAFIDSSGILKTDPFLGTGLLVIRNVGDMADKLCKNSQPARETVRTNKKVAIADLIASNQKDEAIRILMNNSRFEMKFDNVRGSVEDSYKKMIDIFFSDAENRFSATVVKRPTTPEGLDGLADTWETYTDYAADLIVKEMSELPEDSFCIVLDEISRPRKKPLSLEDTLMAKVRNEIAKNDELDFNNVFGALSIESHSNFLLQLSDILLGAVVYDYKKQSGLVSRSMELRKDALVDRIRTTLGVETLGRTFKAEAPAYFSVTEMA